MSHQVTFSWRDVNGNVTSNKFYLKPPTTNEAWGSSKLLLEAINNANGSSFLRFSLERHTVIPDAKLKHQEAQPNHSLVLVFNTSANTLGAVALPYCNFTLEPCDPLPSVAQPLVDHLLLLGCDEAGAAFTSFHSAFTQRDFDFSHLRMG